MPFFLSPFHRLGILRNNAQSGGFITLGTAAGGTVVDHKAIKPEIRSGYSLARKAAKDGPVFITDRGRPTRVLLTIEE
jgi:hypothetical protein